MSYCIRSLCPRTDIAMGCHGFQIDLSPEFREYVARSKITEENISNLLANGNHWLDACGYNQPFEYDGKKERLYEARTSLMVSWGDWGPEHISVPGNACGLDIDRGGLSCIFQKGVMLLPHNIDSWPQKQLLLIVFTEIAESVMLLGRKET